MNKKLNIGVVGLGFIGKKHIECYEKMDTVNLAAVADINAQVLAKECDYKFKVYTDLDEMLRCESLDAVDVCLPTVFHKEAVNTALHHGCHVIVEKPFALQSAEIDEMLECSVKNGRRLMVAHVCRFMQEYRFAKEVITSQSLGKPLYYYACRNSATPKWSSNNWLADKKFSGGTVMDLQIHDIDIANWLLGEPTEYKMVEINNPQLGTSNFGHIISTIKYSDKEVAVLEAGHLMPDIYPFYTAYRLICEKGVIEFSRGADIKFTLCKENELNDMTEEYHSKYEDINPYFEELSHFADCILNNKEFDISTEEAKKAVNTVNKLLENMF
ncbi:MAG: Gfo/Idh/MocA family oxidoreductase [Eubacteriales bacterium]|nr:Gfo/Idh/MocA family oxidoreductase [Eubacteriales bacterium]